MLIQAVGSSTRSAVTAALLGVALVWSGGATAGQLANVEEIESKAWDGQVVTSMAKNLAESLSQVEDAFRKEPGNMMPTVDRRWRHATKQDLRRLRREARHLARELESGKGLEETRNIFLKVQEFAYDAARDGKQAALTKTTLDHIAKARTQLAALAPYFGETWVPAKNAP